VTFSPAACGSTGIHHDQHTNQNQDDREAVMTTVSAERLARIFVEVADTLVDEFDLIDFLHMLADRTADLVGASAVGLLVADQRGRLKFLAASDENTKLLELFQVQNREGPCLDAFRTATPVINTDLAGAGVRWPRFAAQATAAGFRSVHAFPLRLRSEVIGALNVFGSQPGGTLHEADVPIVQALADLAAISLLQERAIRRGEILTEQLQGALNSRIVIEQAKGAVAQACGVSVDEAFTLIRNHARRTNRRLGDVAHAITTDPAALRELASPESR
jgi:GAF domain-containing protein